MRKALAVAFLLIPGCFNGSIEYRALDDYEWGAAQDTRASMRADFECEAAERENLFVWEAPQREIARYCSGGRTDRGIMACVTGTYENGPFRDGANIHILWDAGYNLHTNLIQHEILHVLLGCSAGTFDRGHRRPEWDFVLPEARELNRMTREIPSPDPYEIPETPWDLAGTVWEGRDCEVQPETWIDRGLVGDCP